MDNKPENMQELSCEFFYIVSGQQREQVEQFIHMAATGTHSGDSRQQRSSYAWLRLNDNGIVHLLVEDLRELAFYGIVDFAGSRSRCFFFHGWNKVVMFGQIILAHTSDPNFARYVRDTVNRSRDLLERDMVITLNDLKHEHSQWLIDTLKITTLLCDFTHPHNIQEALLTLANQQYAEYQDYIEYYSEHKEDFTHM